MNGRESEADPIKQLDQKIKQVKTGQVSDDLGHFIDQLLNEEKRKYDALLSEKEEREKLKRQITIGNIVFESTKIPLILKALAYFGEFALTSAVKY